MKVKTRTCGTIEVQYCVPQTVRSVRIVAPNTRRLKPTFSVDRGENVHGDLTHDFYIVPNSDSDSTHWIVWAGDTGAQRDDNIPRLEPIACWKVDEPLRPDGNELPRSSVVAITVYIAAVWLKQCFGAQAASGLATAAPLTRDGTMASYRAGLRRAVLYI